MPSVRARPEADSDATQVRSRFVAAWLQGTHPQIDDFLPNQPADPALLLELAQLDLVFRLKGGEDVAVEAYFQRYPELKEDEAAAVSLIVTEYELTRASASRTSLEDYLSRFPEYLERLRGHLGSAGAYMHTTVMTNVHAGPSGGPTTPSRPRIGQSAGQLETGTVQQVGQYEVLGELGRGGMGVVYKARHVGLNRIVALKMVLSGEHASARDLARFQSEAEAVARLQHPNIVQIYEIGEHQGRPFFALEFVDGGSLADQLDGKPIPGRQAAQLTSRLARAVYYAHQRGILHRDLKPANILLTMDGPAQNNGAAAQAPPVDLAASFVPKLTDFGLARQLDGDATRQTRTGAVVGTPSYMAPEQAAGQHDQFGPPLDVYSLGVILFEMLTGRPPFLGETAMDTLLQVVNEDPVPPRRLQPKVPRDLETICLKCLQKQPSRRYASGQLLALDLERFLNGEPIQARRVGALERAFKWARRRRTTAVGIAAAVVVVLVLLFGSVVYLQREHQHSESLRGEVRALILRARQAVANGAYPNASEAVTAAESLIRGDAVVADLANDPELEAIRARLQARRTLERFRTERDAAMFQATLSFGEGAQQKLELTRNKARQALASVGVQVADQQQWTLPPSFNEDEKNEIKYSAYELLMALAEAVGQPLPGQKASAQESNAKQAVAILDRAAALGMETHAYHLCRARHLEKAGRLPEEVQQQHEQAQRRPPSGAVDFYLLGTVSYKDNKAGEASAHFREALRLQPGHFWARYYLALCLMQLDRFELARDNLTACLGEQPKLPWIYLMRGFVLGQLKEYAAAEVDFAQALVLLKSEPNKDAEYALYNNRGVILTNQGPKRFADAISDFNNAIKLKEKQYQAYVSLSQAYFQQKDLDQALVHLDRGILVAVEQLKALEIEQATLALLHRERAQLNEERRQYDDALRDLERAAALEEGPALARTLLERGRLLQQRQRYADAVAACDAALKIAPDQPEAQRRKGETLYQMERHEDAAAALSEFLRLGGKPSVKVYQMRAAARSKLGQYQAAANDYTLALELESKEPNKAVLHLARGHAFLACQAYLPAQADFQEALRHDPASGAAYNGLGFARVKLRQYKEAVSNAELAVRLGPVTHQLLYNSARIYAQAAGTLDNDPKPDRQLQELRGKYQAKAVELIERALQSLTPPQRTSFWQDTVGRDGAIDPVRRTPGFQRLAQGFPAPAPGKP